MLISTGGMQSKSKVAAVDMRRTAAALKMFPNYYTSCFYRLRKQELPAEVRSQSSAPTLSCTPGLISNCLLSWSVYIRTLLLLFYSQGWHRCLVESKRFVYGIVSINEVSCLPYPDRLAFRLFLYCVSDVGSYCQGEFVSTKRFGIKGTLYKG